MHTSSSLSAVSGTFAPLLQPKVLPSMREALRFCRYNLKTEKPYVRWVKRYI